MYYYFRLALKKIKIFLYNKFEKKVKSDPSVDLYSFILFLIKETFKNLIVTKKGIYYKTEIANNNEPGIISQARLISLLCDGYNKEHFPIKDNNLIEKLTNYLITLKKKNDLYHLSNYKWDKQDEGIASVWSAIALIKAYEVLGKKIYLDESLSVCTAMLKDLYSARSGLVHTAGQDFWCINASSKFAYLCSLILKYYYSEEIKEAMLNSISICTKNIAEDGHFPYTKAHPGVYILLYHPSVIFYMEKCLESEYLDDEFKLNLNKVNKTAFTYLLKCLDNSGRFNEPEFKEYNFYKITAVTALAAIADKIERDQEKKS